MNSQTRSRRRSRTVLALVLAVLAAVGVRLSAQQAVSSNNVNMVSGTTFPDGDPYLQRQNEPNAAVSTRNELHLLAGANDYRTVDLPGPFDPMRGFKMAADAWVGLFKSVDGGQNWKSTLLPGFPQDVSPEGLSSPIKGREGATDPILRAGTNGLFYYAGVAFDRGGNRPSSIFVARYMDLNNVEAGDPFGYVDTRLVDSDLGTRFLDKVALAVDIPRSAATCTITTRQYDGAPVQPTVRMHTIPAGTVYVAYAAFTGSGATEQSVIMISRSTNCGATWSAPLALSTGSRLVQNPQIAISPTDGAVHVSWRRFKYLTQDDAVMVVKSVNLGATFSKPLRVSGVRPFDQQTEPTRFRSNGFQTMAVDGAGRVYLAWPDRGYAATRNDPVTGDSRIVISTSTTGSTWSVPRAIQPSGVGHQLMPAMTFHGGKLRILYYDLREDVSQLFGQWIDESSILTGAPPRIRHTMDVFVAQAAPGGTPTFTTARVSEYASGFLPGSTVEQRLQFNPPNLPLFRQGAVPFMGDYIDLAPAPAFVLNDNGTWSFNTGANGSAVSHALWTDNRDVRPPADGNWANYTPVTSDAVGVQSRFDPTQQVPSCEPGQVGMRNQNIYTARVTDGLFVSAPGNNKQFNGFQRAFVVVAENASTLPRTYRLRIENQPIGGQASFLQFGPALTTLDVSTPPLSSVARSIFVTAQDQNARIRVTVTQINGVGGTIVANGLTGTVVLNPDPQNPVLQNPVLQNPVLQNISQGESYNPGISAALVGVPNLQNPSLQNPNLQNPNLQNPSIQNPHLQNPNLQNPTLQNPVLQNDAVANPSIVNADVPNPNLQNPTLQNPNLQNPSLQNPNLQNAGISDTNWVVTNEGNTTASYTVNLLLNSPVPAGFSTQLLIHKTFTTPAADGCELKQQPHTILLANIPNPQFVTDPTNPNLQNPHLQNPSLQNPTLALAPGETATITFRVVDPNIFDGVAYDASAAVTPAAVAQSVNTVDVAAGDTTPSVALPLTIATSEIPPTTPGAPITRTLGIVAATGTVSCFVAPGLGTLPAGVTLSSTGTLSGTPTTPGNYVFTVECVDSGPPERRDRQTLTIQVNPASPVGYDALWNGLDTNWYNPANWSPRGVPAETSRVYLSAATEVVPTLTADVTVRDLFLEPGATLDTNGFTLTVTNNADAGRTIVGPGQTVLTGNGSAAAGVFSNLVIAGRITLSAPLTTTGSLTLAPGARLELNGQPLIVGGQLITNVTGGTLPMVVGAAVNSFIVTGVNVNGLVLNAAPLTINGAALTRFDNVSFSGFAPEAIQLTVNNPGLLTHFPMNGLSFASQPTSGQYISATDTQPGGPLLILDVTGAVPADGSAFTLENSGAEVNWLGNPGEANLAVTQTVAPVPAAAGTRLTYQITVTNGGPAAAAGVVLNEQVPLGATGVLASTPQGSCTPGPIGVSCALGTIAAGASVQATVSFLTTLTGTLSTTAVVTSTTPDAVIANNSHTIGAVIVPAGQGVDLRLTKTDSIDPVGLNAPFTYTLTVANVGATEATNVVVTDNVPAGISIQFATSPSGMCSAISTQVLCSFASILPGQSVTMTFHATGTSVGAWTNQASVTSAQVELTPADNVVAETTMVVAVANCGAGFGPPALLSTPSNSFDVMSGDLNGDGRADLVTTMPQADAVAVFLATADGGFTPAVTYPAGDGALEGVLVDLNNDGRLDLAIEGLSAAFVLFGNGAGGFAAPVSLSFGTAIVSDVRAGDLNGDGRQDLLIATIGPDNVHAYLQSTAGALSLASTTAVSADPVRLVVRDLNGDGRLDVVASHQVGSQAVPAPDFVSILLGNGAGGFATPSTVPLGQDSWISFVSDLGDLNGDGHRDLGVAQFNTNRLVLLLGNGSGAFVPQLLGNAPAGIVRAVSGDVNGDGSRDIVYSTSRGIAIQLGDGQGNFAAPVLHAAATSGEVHLIDVNGDGRLDVAVGSNGAPAGVVVLLNLCGQPSTDLSLTITDSPDPVVEGNTVTYSATITNLGANAAPNATFTQVLPSGYAATASSSSGTCTVAGRLVSCNVGLLAAGASVTVDVLVTTISGTTLTTTATVSSDSNDSDLSNNSATTQTVVTSASRELVVTNTNNAGAGSLRQAILDSNADSGDRDTIVFNIPGTGVRTITPLTALPVISQPVVIDGTQPPDSTPLIELNGNGLAGPGLTITGGNSIVRGLVINRFGGPGILLQTNGGNVIAGNYIGVDALATTSRPNGGHGVQIDGTSGNTVGGLEPAARNVISGNLQSGISISGAAATGNLVAGNFIGTNGSGMSAISNNAHGVLINNSSGNTVGTPDAGNVISGNVQNGIAILGASSAGNQIYANRIGVNVLSSAALGNLQDGIRIEGAASTVIGGVGLARNVIGGNAQNGIGVYSSTAGAAAPGTQIVGNTIGFRSPPNTVGNGLSGVHLGFASNTIIGGDTQDATNLISWNGRNGVTVLSGTGNRINGNNSIADNSILGIDLGNDGITSDDAGDGDTGPNNLQNFPALTATAAGVQGTLNSLASSLYTIQFFANQACDGSGNGEGETFLGAVSANTDGTGNAVIPLFAATAGQIISATATSASGDTSEFSACVVVPLGPTTFTVNSTADSGPGSLRQAILDANARSLTLDTIRFDLQGTGPFSIAPASALPAITDAVIIDGTTQGGYAGSPVIEIAGNNAGASANGLTLGAGGSTIRGLAINRFSAAGILGTGGGGHVLEGNYIGTDLAGGVASPNGVGVDVRSGNNRIGGTTIAARNVISGNADGVRVTGVAATGTIIQGNYVGLDAGGTRAVPNVFGVILSSTSGNQVGGLTASARNIISGNTVGVGLLGSTSPGNTVQGNYIGLNATGSAAVPNTGHGVQFFGATSFDLLGGTAAGTGNVISGNTNGVSFFFNSTNNRVQGNTIGLNPAGTSPIPNTGTGVLLNGGPQNLIGGLAPGAGNIISGNSTGVAVALGTGNPSVGNSILSNSIFGNTGLGINLDVVGPSGPVTPNDAGDGDSGPNNLQNFPVLAGVTGGVGGTLNSAPNAAFTLQFFANAACDSSGHGEGQTLLGTVTVNTAADGNAAIPVFAAAAGQIITATATSSGGDTSEFSACVTVPAAAASADLFLEMTESADPVPFGAPFTWSVLAQNEGPSIATNVVVTNTLPAGVTLASAVASQGSCTVQNRTVTCALGTLAVSASATITLNVTGAVAGVVHNSAFVTANEADPVNENNAADVETTVTLAACAAPSYSGPVALAVPSYDGVFVKQADLNGDGANDLVVSMILSGLAVRMNDGGGGFSSAVPIALPDPPAGFALADVNRDGRVDIAAVTGSGLQVLIGAGNGTFAAAVTYPATADGPITVTAADLDNDADLDLILDSSEGEQVLQVFRNNGSGVFAAGVNVPTAFPDSVFPVVADLNRDGIPDIAVGSLRDEGQFSVLLADGAGGYLPSTSHGNNVLSIVQAAADLNGDGNTDLIVLEGFDPGLGVRVFLGNGTGGFDAGTEVSAGATARALTLADVNRDGRPDLVVHHPSLETVAVQLGQAGGAFAAPIHFPAPYSVNPQTELDDHGGEEDFISAPSVGDLNGDGQLDLAVPDPSGAIHLLLSTCGQPAGDLSVTAQDSADPVVESQSLTYTVAVTNHGPGVASGGTLHLSVGGAVGPREVPPARFTSVTGDASCTVTAQHVTCAVPVLEPAEPLTLQVNVTTLAASTLTLSATVTSANADPTPANNTALETTTVTSNGGRNIAVTNTSDTGPGSLRNAIAESNADSGDRDTIVFNIPGAGVRTIVPAFELTAINAPVVIDGTTQPGFGTTPVIELNGNFLGANGLRIFGGNSIVRGLAINRFGGFGILVQNAGGNVIDGNHIGTNPAGTLAQSNGSGGILVQSANNRIGGLTPAARNVISGNAGTGIVLGNSTATGNVVQGNYIGVNVTGTAALPNTLLQGGINVTNGANGNTIGGSVAGAGNVVSGHTQNAITVFGSNTNDNVIQGNFIGTNPTGATRLANGGIGVDIVSGQRTIVGGAGLARNVISGNGTGMQIRTGAAGTVVQNNYIGVNAAGTAAIFNGTGITINDNAIGNTIGGSTAGLGNVISGNTANGLNVASGSNGTIIQGNFIGVDAAGTADLGNTADGINLNGVSGTIVGGTTPGARNVVSGNNSAGIRVTGAAATGNQIRGNYIGVNALGSAAVLNTNGGVILQTGAGTNVIGGTEAGAGNLISGNGLRGVLVQTAANGNSIQGNAIGLNAAGSLVLGNTGDGISVNAVSGTTIGGTTAGAGNIISGNTGNGINVAPGSTGTVIQGNRIGTNASGSASLPNGNNGIFLDGNGTTVGGTAAGATNIIANNGQAGVNVPAGAGHAILGNSIFSNGALGINLGPPAVGVNDAGDGDLGANNLQNFPVLAAAAGGVQGSFNSTPNGTFTIQYYGNTACDPSQNGEGQTFLGAASVTTDANGNATLPLFTAAPDLIVTATATSATNDTSEFSTCVTVPSAPPSADLSVVASDSADPVTLGTPFNYVLVAHNAGPSAATGVVVTNTLPTGVTASSAISTVGSCTIGDITVTCSIGALGVNASATVTIEVTSAVGGVLTNTASIAGAQADPVSGNNSDSEQTTIELAACTAVSYSGPVAYPVPARDGFWVKHGDFNGDGQPDLVTSMAGSGVVLQFNNGGVFGAAIPVISGQKSWGLSLEDFNGDGRLDLAVMTGEDATSNLTVLFGTGGGTFGAGATFPLGQSDPADLTAGDLDNDGDVDLVAGGFNDEVLQVFRNDGSGSFPVRQTLATTADSPATPVIARINADAFPDIVVGDIEDGGVRVILADGTGGFQAESTVLTGGRTVVWSAADLNGDGIADLLTQEGEPGATTTLLRAGNGNGEFQTPVDLGSGASAAAVTVADANSDGRLDLVVRHPSRNTIAVQPGNGSGAFASSVHFPLPHFVDPEGELNELDDEFGWPFRPVVVADLNGDGRPDLAAGDGLSAVQVLLNTCGEPAADLSVSVGETADPVAEGAPLSYTVTVTNLGPANVTGGRLTVALPSAVDDDELRVVSRFVFGTPGCTVGESVATCPVISLPSGNSAAFVFDVETFFGSTVTFTAGVTSGRSDPNPADNTVTETTTVTAAGREIVVTNTNDSGPGSLRHAIELSNSDPDDVDRIVFQIPGTGVQTISVLSGLAVGSPAIIDGRTQWGVASGPPIVELRGLGSGDGLLLVSGTTVRGLSIGGFQRAVTLAGNGNRLEGNYFGVDPTGNTATPNVSGVEVFGSSNVIGGTAAIDRNVISGNLSDGIRIAGPSNVVIGNYIGTNATGTADLGNGQNGVYIGFPFSAPGSSGNRIGGPSAQERNVLSGNNSYGVLLDTGTSSNTVQGNYIGTNASGSAAIGNTLGGIRVSSPDSVIGGTGTGAGNLISGNGPAATAVGIELQGATGTTVQGNLIGPNAAGTGALANGIGISVNASNNTLGGSQAGAANVISGNATQGVRITAGTGNAVLNNQISSNGNLGIDLGNAGVTPNDSVDADTGANNLQNFPVLSAVAGGVQGTLSSTPGSTFTIQFFANAACDSSGNGEGQTFLGSASVTTGGTGAAVIPLFGATTGQIVTATATSSTNDTSEFSACVTVPTGPVTFTVSNTNSTGPGSLRQAILDANARTNTRDTIAFNIPGAGPHSIVLQTPLPIINDGVIIDGTTEPDYAVGAPVVELDGSALADAYGLHVTASFTTIRGLVISGFGAPGGSTNGVGIALENSVGHLIEGNFIGTDVTGMIAKPNRLNGIQMVDVDTSTIGGTTADSRNVISGNGSSGLNITSGSNNNVVSGNYIGLNRLGTAGLPNGQHGISIFASNANGIGGGSAAARNVVSGNVADGISISLGNSNTVTSNYIGLNAAGGSAIGNGGRGIYVQGQSNNIGTTQLLVPGLGNVVSGNQVGITLDGGSLGIVMSNRIGLDASGTAPLGNITHGIHVASSANSYTIRQNTVSANGGNGILLNGSANGNLIQGNVIGVPAGGSSALGNAQNGVLVTSGTVNTIGAAPGNVPSVIAGNGGNGVAIVAPAASIRILSSSIFGNALRGIDLGNNGVTLNDAGDTDGGANNQINFPVLATAPGGVSGTFNGRPNTFLTIQYFANTNAGCDSSGHGEGETFLASFDVTTDGSGNVALPFVAADPGTVVTATATTTGDGTSEFSACVTAASSNRAPVANAGPDQSVLAGTVVQLNGGGSSDPDANPLTYAWTLTKPAGSGTSLSSATAAAPTFLADVPGIYTVRLVVNDGALDSPFDDVVIDAATPRVAGLIGSYFGAVSQLDGGNLPIVPATSPTFIRSVPSIQFGTSTNFQYRPCLLTGSNCLNAAYTVRWIGRIDLVSGSHTFALNSSDASQLLIGGTSVVSNPGRHAAATAQGVFVSPSAGSYSIEVRFTTAGTTPGIDLLYQPPGAPGLAAVPAVVLWSDGTFLDFTSASAASTVSFANPATPPAPGGSAPVDGASAAVSFMNPAPVSEPGGTAPVSATGAAVSFFSPAAVPEPGGAAPVAAVNATVSFTNPAPVPEPGGTAPVASTSATVSFENPSPTVQPGGSEPVAASVSSVGYASGPVVTGLAPLQLSRSGGGGQLVISGSNLQNASAVLFDGAAGISASAPSVSPDGRTVTVTVTITGAATTGLVVVTVSTPAGTSAATAATVLEIVQ